MSEKKIIFYDSFNASDNGVKNDLVVDMQDKGIKIHYLERFGYFGAIAIASDLPEALPDYVTFPDSAYIPFDVQSKLLGLCFKDILNDFKKALKWVLIKFINILALGLMLSVVLFVLPFAMLGAALEIACDLFESVGKLIEDYCIDKPFGAVRGICDCLFKIQEACENEID